MSGYVRTHPPHQENEETEEHLDEKKVLFNKIDKSIIETVTLNKHQSFITHNGRVCINNAACITSI